MSSEPWSSLISVQGVMNLHAEGIRLFGGSLTTRPAEDCVEGSLGNAWSAGLYSEPEETRRGLCFAGYTLYYLAKDHCFTDGNKRISWMSAMEILARLGVTVKASTDEAEQMILDVITGAIRDAGGVVLWLAERLEVLTLPPSSTEPPLPS